jgi:hypothetical protein
MSNSLSLTPGFSPVITNKECQNRFNGFSSTRKPLKRLAGPNASTTRLKPGVNESNCGIARDPFPPSSFNLS